VTRLRRWVSPFRVGDFFSRAEDRSCELQSSDGERY
jgi:hypothetical protein